MPDRFSTLRSFSIRQYWCRFVRLPVFLICGLLVAAETVWAQSGASSGSPSQQDNSCSGDNGGLTLSPGFCATVFADNIGHVRHMAVAPNGVLYVNTWSGRYYHNDTPPAGGFLVALKDIKGDGRADVIERFGDGVAQGSAGGTGIAFYNGARLRRAERQDHPLCHPGGFDCAAADRRRSSSRGCRLPAITRCIPSSSTRRATFMSISARRPIPASPKIACRIRSGASPAPSSRPAPAPGSMTPTRPASISRRRSAMSPGCATARVSPSMPPGRLFVTQHGRDQLSQNWPKLYTAAAKRRAAGRGNRRSSNRAPITAGRNAITTDFQKKLVLAPEYGGDGGKKVGVCAEKTAPVAAFPGHWAPNDLLIYTGKAFPGGLSRRRLRRLPRLVEPRAASRRAATTWCSSRSRTARLPGDFHRLRRWFCRRGQRTRPGGVPADRARDGARRRALIFPTTSTAASGASPITALPTRRSRPAPAPKVAAATSGEPGPPEGIHPDAGRPGHGLAAGSARRHQRAGRLRRPHLPRRSGRRHLHRLPWLGRARRVRRRRRWSKGRWLHRRRQPQVDHTRPSSMACRGRTITKCRCRRRAARHCRIPMLQPSRLMSGRSARPAAARSERRFIGRRLVDHDRRRAHAFAFDNTVKGRGIAGIEPHAAVRGRAAEPRNLVGAVNGEAAVEEDRMRHRRIIIFL